MPNKIKKLNAVISWGNSLDLAESLSKKLSVPLLCPKVYKFPNGETSLRVENFDNCFQRVLILKSLGTQSNDSLIEVLLCADALKRLNVKNVCLCAPWLAYSPQNKIFRKGEPLSCKVIAQILDNSPIDSFIFLDLHAASILDFFEKQAENITGKTIICFASSDTYSQGRDQ